VAVPLFDFLGKLVDHGSLVSSPTLSNNLVCVGVLTCCACALIMVAAHMLVAAHSVHLFPLSRTEAADSSPPGLAELLSCVDSSDTLEAVAAWCKATGVNHVTDLVGREQTFAMELSNLMPPTKRDALLEALAAVSAKHVGVWTRSDQDEAVEALKVLALAERIASRDARRKQADQEDRFGAIKLDQSRFRARTAFNQRLAARSPKTADSWEVG
jgi:hypothetical protein